MEKSKAGAKNEVQRPNLLLRPIYQRGRYDPKQ